MRHKNIVGNTPLINITKNIYAKLETYNPTGSIKDRIIHYICEEEKRNGLLRPSMTLVEATSGNTGIALAAYGAANNHPVKIIMPQNMSEGRKKMIALFGAEIIQVGDYDFEKAIEIRDELVENNKDYWSPNQFENQLNIECHYNTTAHEISEQLESMGLKWGSFASGAGTGGTIMGVNKFLQKFKPDAKTYLILPKEEQHDIQGIGDGDDFLVNKDLIEDVITVSTSDAKDEARKLTIDLGIPVGTSSGANIFAAKLLAEKINDSNLAIVTILCDRGERYLSSS